MFDAIIIGGGPAGLSAAIWCGDLGLKYCLIERSAELGGQLHSIHLPINNYPGIRTISSSEFLKNLVEGLHGESSVRPGVETSSVLFDPISICLETRETLTARSLIIATGVRRRELGVPGEREFFGKGILPSGAENPDVVAGHDVVIVGGGDAALENAAILAPHAAKIYVVHRGSTFSARPEILKTARLFKNVQFVFDSVVAGFAGNATLTEVMIRNVGDGEITPIAATRALIRIGVVPNSELFMDMIATDSKGYIEIDRNCQTNIAGVFAVGDVASPVSPTLVTAAGMAATAAKMISGVLPLGGAFPTTTGFRALHKKEL